jgi:folate-dependent phosphoribosylglycinamide formyltransferase PurN
MKRISRDKITKPGVMIHYVIEELVDEGQSIIIKEIEVQPDESLESLESRIYEIEHEEIVEGTNIPLATIKKLKETGSG